MVDLLLSWLAEYGYPVVFLAALLENLFPVGFLVPGEVIVLSAAVASPAASLNPAIVAALGAAGETAGELLSFALGRVAGVAAIDRLAARFPRLSAPLERTTSYFREHGAWAIVLGRPAWGIKATLPVVAGMSGMPAWKAIVLVTVSSLYYYPALVAIAYLFGLSFTTLAEASTALSIVFAVVLTVVFGLLWRAHHRRHHGA